MIHWKDIKLSPWLAGGLSVAAFVLSLISFYVTGVRVTDDLRVVAGEMPSAEPDFAKKQFDIPLESTRYIFINSGMRSAIISGMTLLLAQPQEGSELPDSGCQISKAHVTRFDVEPFVLKSGEMIAKDATLRTETRNTRQKRPSQANLGGVRVASVPFSEPNAKSKKVRFRMCIEVAFTTPSVEIGVKTVNEFEDESMRAWRDI